MSVQNINIRVKQYYKGWVVEVQKEKRFLFFFKKKYWTHIISVSGIYYFPWYYCSKEMAIEDATKQLKWELLRNVNYLQDE